MPWKELRDRILFAFGLSGLTALFVVWVITGRDPNYSLLIACLGIVGSPFALQLDEQRRGRGHE